MLTAAYLGAMLTHVDPNKAPKLEDILGDEPSQQQPADSDTEADPRGNALQWFAVMDGLQRKKPKPEENGHG